MRAQQGFGLRRGVAMTTGAVAIGNAISVVNGNAAVLRGRGGGGGGVGAIGFTPNGGAFGQRFDSQNVKNDHE